MLTVARRDELEDGVWTALNSTESNSPEARAILAEIVRDLKSLHFSSSEDLIDGEAVDNHGQRHLQNPPVLVQLASCPRL